MKKRALILGFLIAQLPVWAALNPVVDSIPMRDGKKLAADVYIPIGCTSCPTILIQTPYNRLLYRFGLPLGVGQQIDNSPYVYVIVDWRGFYGSSSAMIASPNRGQDGYDVVDWISQQSWSDGKVGTWGPSALGKIQYETAREQHPAHLCAVPLVASPRFEYEEYYHGGVYRTEYLQQLDALGYGLSSVVLANPVKNLTWTFAYNQSNYPASITIPCMMIGGWYDHASDAMLSYFSALRTTSPLAVRNKHRLIMGPWVHGGHGAAYVGSALQGELSYPGAEGWGDSLALAFLDHYLRGISNGIDLTEYVTYFQMGEDEWNVAPSWPPSGVSPIKLYLQNDFSLGTVLPSNGTGASLITFDPRNPSPTIGGPTLRSDLDQGPYNQAPLVESRNDVLIFESPVLGAPVVMKGNVRAHFYVSSNRKDTDVAVRITDVYPDGRSMILLDGIRRMRFRNGFTAADTASMIPGQIYEVDVQLMNSAITFLPGHRIRLDITSSNYPRFDVNLNNGGAMYVAGDTLVAQNTIYHNASQASYIELRLEDFIGETPEDLFVGHKLFPNPANEFLELTVPGNSEFSWEIFDVQGKSQKSGTCKGENRVVVAELYPGLYVLQYTINGKSYRVKWVKSK
ncbi:MAG TPA: CocE/NonD family hydrolase [Flavobacteriales bacterium]|nr:CocE/NonD family hydrolase [Flavobacteriales bacterium]HRJ39201.1 CocE/NonD family hydrolase [Flavobacteriales bacterium]